MSEPQTLANGRYLLVKRLGEGGMATVYRGFDQRLQVWRAVKVLLPEFAKKKKIMARFEVEAQTMAMLEHPNIVRVYDVDREGDFPYIVMELVEGGCLVDWLEKNGPMPSRMALDCIVETLQALQYTHNRQIIHRDIKPHNIMIDRDGVCRLTDFGIARAGDSEESLTKTGAVMGTWGFMAPEQRTDSKHVDGRADIYAMAASLFSLITDKTPMDLFLAERESDMLDGIPEPLIPVLIKATEYRKEDRYESAQAFAAALLAVRDQLPENPADTPPLVGEVKPLPPPPEAPVAPAEGGPAPRPAAQGTLMPTVSSGVTREMTPNFTLPPMDQDGFEGMSAQQAPTWQPPPQQRDNSMLYVAGGAILVALMAIGVVGYVAINGNQGGGQAVSAAPAPTPIAAAPTPADASGREEPSDAAPAQEPDDAASTPKATSPKPSSSRPPKSSTSGGGSAQAEPDEEPEAKPKPKPAPKPAPAPTPQAFESVVVPASSKVGAKLAFRAKVAKVESDVFLHYRGKGGGAWSQAKMGVLMGQKGYTLDVRPEYADGLEYYLSSEGVTYGSATHPKVVQISGGATE